MNEYEDLIRDREFCGEMVKLGESIAVWCEKHGKKFRHSTSELLDWFAMLEAESVEKIAALDAEMAQAVEGPPAEDAWLYDAMTPRKDRWHDLMAQVVVTSYWE